MPSEPSKTVSHNNIRLIVLLRIMTIAKDTRLVRMTDDVPIFTPETLEEKYHLALLRIRARAFSDLPCDELEDAQEDLREIFKIADEAVRVT